MSKQRAFDPEGLGAALASPQWEQADLDRCPVGERIYQAACGRLKPAELAEIVDHVAECAVCAHELRAARQIAEDLGEIPPHSANDPNPVPPIPDVPPDPSLLEGMRAIPTSVIPWIGVPTKSGGYAVAWRPLATAAVLTAVVSRAVIPAPAPTWPGLVQYRSGESAPIVHLLVPDGQSLPRDRFELRWQGLAAARYDVRVMTTDLEEVAVGTDLGTAELLLEEDDLKCLEAGTMLLWQVDAYLPDGGRVPSVTYQVRLERGAQRPSHEKDLASGEESAEV